MKKLVSFTNSFSVFGNDAYDYYSDSVFGAITIDGYPADKYEFGEAICNIICTKQGELITVWINNAYRLNPTVIKLIENSKIKLLNEFDKVKTRTYLAYIESFAVRDIQYAKTYMPDPWDDNNWLDSNETRIHIGLFNANNEQQARNMAARFMDTVPENIGLIPVSTSVN